MIPVFDEKTLLAFSKLLETPKNIVITTHYKPDGDALGSSLGLGSFLKRIGHNVTVVAPSEYPDFLKWMVGSNEVIDFLKNGSEAKQAFQNADLVCCLDFNDSKRVEAMENTLMKSTAPRMLLDHHLDPKEFCDFTFSFPQIGSTAELVFQLISALGGQKLIDKDAAECLYAGIMTDTGSFRYSSVSADTHRVIASLLDAGARNYYVHEKIYDTNTEARLRFLGNSLLNHMQVLYEYNTVIFTATKSDMDRFKHESGDLEGIVNYGLGIKNITMAVLFSEREHVVKISFRSKGDLSVKEIAEKYFEGGGHHNAAGGKSSLSLNDTVAKFVALLPTINKV